jgi:DNA repair exonuclease SbcCD nuclease subunit
MRFIHTADWHIWDKHKYSVDASRLNRIITNAMKIVEVAIDRKVSTIVIAGDIFHISNPTEYLLNIFANIIVFGVNYGIKFRVLIGNHDTDGVNHSLESVQKLIPDEEMFKIISFRKDNDIVIECESIDGANFIFVPWQPNLIEALRQAPYKKINTQKNILVTHVGVSGASVPSGWVSDSSITPSLLTSYDYVALGDYHNYQKVGCKIFQKKNSVYYSGSIFKLNWNEANDTKQFIIVDTAKNPIKISRIKLYDPAFIDMSVDYKDIKETFADDDILTELGGRSLKDSIVKLNVHGNIGLGIDVSMLEKILYNSGSKMVFTKLMGTDEESSSEDEEINLSLDAEEAILKWAEKHNYTRKEINYCLKEILGGVK